MRERRLLHSIGQTLALGMLLSAVTTVPAGAQRLSEARAGITSASALPFDGAAQQQAAARKEPALAGVISFLVPGVGSFYAGNNRHGAIHLGIHVASLVVYVVGLAAAVETFDSSTGELSGGSFAVAGVGLLALLVNNVWSIFTAVGDANAYNSKGSGGGRVVGELHLAPEVRVLRAIQIAPLTTQTDKAVGMQLLKLQF